MTNDYIRRQDVLNLPKTKVRNFKGEVIEESIDIDDVKELEPADVVKVVRCKDCKHHAYDEIFSCYWCEYPGRVRNTTPDGFCDKGEE